MEVTSNMMLEDCQCLVESSCRNRENNKLCERLDSNGCTWHVRVAFQWWGIVLFSL